MAYVTPGTVAAGDVATAAAWNVITNDVIDHESRLTQIKRLGFTSRTTNVAIDQTTLAAASNIFPSSITFTADGTSAYRVEFFCSFYQTATDVGCYFGLNLTNAAGTDLGGLVVSGQSQVAGKRVYGHLAGTYYYTPSAGSTTINMRGSYAIGAANGHLLYAGTGGVGTQVPMYLAVFGPDLT